MIRNKSQQRRANGQTHYPVGVTHAERLEVCKAVIVPGGRQPASADEQHRQGGGSQGGGTGTGGSTGAGPSSIPPDIPDGSDDDVVARQIREAAMKETDPELRAALWEEYRKYKKGQ